jgi:NAD(P)-dependent dehydrogenase (short-subunit alcohol dehydrogenase family)
MDTRLDGRTALVTGASSGLGRRFATVLARAGARVALAARRTDELAALAREIAAGGGVAHAVAMDVTDVASVRAGVAAAGARARADRRPRQQLGRQRDQAHRRGRGGRLRPRDGHQRQGHVLRGAGGRQEHDRRRAPGTDR